MAIGNIGLTAALSQMAQEQIKQKLADQESEQKANMLAQALQFHRDTIAQQQAQMDAAAKQHAEALANQIKVAQIGYDKALAVQGMKGETAKEIAAKKAADKKAGIDPQFNNLIKLQGIWKSKGVENLSNPQAQEELLAGIESGTYDPIDAASLIKNPYWSLGPDKDKHDAFEAKKNQLLNNPVSTQPIQSGGGVLINTPITTLPEAAKSQLKEGHNTTFKNGQTWTLQNGQPVRIK